MPVLFVKRRCGADTFWATDGSTIKNDALVEHTDGTLGPDCLPQIALDAFLATYAPAEVAPAALCTLDKIFWDIPEPAHFKEAVLMVAAKAVYDDLKFPTGNQTKVDCYIDGKPTQAKGHMLQYGYANMHCHINGVPRQPYRDEDGLDQALVGCLVESEGRVFLLHALLSKDELLKAGVWGHDGYEGRPACPGTTSVSIPGGEYNTWLTGRTTKVGKKSQTTWLQKPQNGWRAPSSSPTRSAPGSSCRWRRATRPPSAPRGPTWRPSRGPPSARATTPRRPRPASPSGSAWCARPWRPTPPTAPTASRSPSLPAP